MLENIDIPKEVQLRNKEFYENPALVNIIYSIFPSRAGGQLFCSLLEYKWFPPNTDKNKEFTLTFLKWEEMAFAIITLDKIYWNHIEVTAKMTGLVIVDGTPTFINAGSITRFPIDPKNSYVLENEPGHPIYKGSEYFKSFTELEDKLCHQLRFGDINGVESFLNKL